MLFYTHVNEDNSVERQAMAEMAPLELFVIAGSGERVLALLDSPGLKKVYVVDQNPEALYLCALKIAALEQLDVEAYLRFTGVKEGSAQERLQIFSRLAPLLAESCRDFWTAHQADIALGVCHTGHFERFLAGARPWLRFFLGKGFYQCLEKPRAEWRGFPQLRWALVRWFFSQGFTYRLFGLRDSAFLSDDAQLRAIPAAMQQSLEEDRVQHSCLFHLVMNGHLGIMPPENQPPSFQPEILQCVKQALTERRLQIHYIKADALEAVQTLPWQEPCSRFFSLSDLLSFMSWPEMTTLLREIGQLGAGHRRAVFRAFVRHRPGKAELQELQAEFGRTKDLSASENTHFYQVYQIDFPHEKP